MFAIKVKSQSLYLVGNYFFRDLNPVCLNYLFGKLLALFHMNLKYMYIFLKSASAVVLEMVLCLWLLFKNENYKRISQDSLLLLNKTHLEAEMSLDLSSHSTKW